MSLYARKNAEINLEGKTAAVAGGTTGIGAALGERFAQAGASVYVIGRNSDRGSKVIDELKRVGNSRAHYEFIQADLRSVVFPSPLFVSNVMPHVGTLNIALALLAARRPKSSALPTS